ncbi:MAG: translation initiation factor [Candidatus Hydrogenedentes bacterium]|nr:translation initiation factor [Candidatus Hydrogenedentota bacterium]
MHNKKNRADVSSDTAPLTDNPFGGLESLVGSDPKPPVPQGPARPAPQKEPSQPKPLFRVARTRKGGFPVFLEKRAAGKTVTVIRNVTGDADALLSLLRKKCGAGGVIRDGEVELQGDHRAKVEAYLKEQLARSG